jgi:hypothetical protein
MSDIIKNVQQRDKKFNLQCTVTMTVCDATGAYNTSRALPVYIAVDTLSQETEEAFLKAVWNNIRTAVANARVCDKQQEELNVTVAKVDAKHEVTDDMDNEVAKDPPTPQKTASPAAAVQAPPPPPPKLHVPPPPPPKPPVTCANNTAEQSKPAVTLPPEKWCATCKTVVPQSHTHN